MAEDKKSFLLYTDMLNTVKKLPREVRGDLLTVILEYVNDLNPVIENNLLLEVVFEPIKLQLKRDLVRWEEFRTKQAENGKLGGRPRKTELPKPTDENPKNPSLFSESQKSLNVTVNVNDTVNDKDSITEGSKKDTHTPTEVEAFKKFNDWITENAAQVHKMKQPFTIVQFLKIRNELPSKTVTDILANMHNRPDLTKKYLSAYLTLKSWARNEWNKDTTPPAAGSSLNDRLKASVKQNAA